MDKKRELGTVILTSSITKKEPLVGKLQPDGNTIKTDSATYNSVNAWINTLYYDSRYDGKDVDSDDSI